MHNKSARFRYLDKKSTLPVTCMNIKFYGLLVWIYLVFEKVAMKEASTAISRPSKQTVHVFNSTYYSHLNVYIYIYIYIVCAY